MRSASRLKLVQAALPASRVDLDASRAARKIFVDRFGPQCAAWLVNEHRESIRSRGVIDFHVPRQLLKRLPMWFSLAVECLADRAGWEVVRSAVRSVVVWRIKWVARGQYRELVERARNPS